MAPSSGAKSTLHGVVPRKSAAAGEIPRGASSSPRRRLAREHLRHHRRVDVLPRHDEADAAALHAVALLHQRGERRRAGALGQGVGGAEIEADRLGDLVLGDLDDAVGAVRGSPRAPSRRAPAPPDCRRRCGRHWSAPRCRRRRRARRRWRSARRRRRCGSRSFSASRTPIMPQMPEPSPIGT